MKTEQQLIEQMILDTKTLKSLYSEKLKNVQLMTLDVNYSTFEHGTTMFLAVNIFRGILTQIDTLEITLNLIAEKTKI